MVVCIFPIALLLLGTACLPLGAAWPSPSFSLMGKIYESKIMADRRDDENCHDRDRLRDYIPEYYSHSFGVSRETKRKLAALRAGVKSLAMKNKRVYWFGWMMGLVEPKTSHPIAIDFFLLFLKQVRVACGSLVEVIAA